MGSVAADLQRRLLLDFVVFVPYFSHLLTVLHAQIVVLDIEVDVRQDQL
jgi:hypothetical protein